MVVAQGPLKIYLMLCCNERAPDTRPQRWGGFLSTLQSEAIHIAQLSGNGTVNGIFEVAFLSHVLVLSSLILSIDSPNGRLSERDMHGSSPAIHCWFLGPTISLVALDLVVKVS